jgi:hypothetical protein
MLNFQEEDENDFLLISAFLRSMSFAEKEEEEEERSWSSVVFLLPLLLLLLGAASFFGHLAQLLFTSRGETLL